MYESAGLYCVWLLLGTIGTWSLSRQPFILLYASLALGMCVYQAHLFGNSYNTLYRQQPGEKTS